MCTRETHDEMKDVPERVLRETTAVGPFIIFGEVLGHLRNCVCGSTLMLTPEQHAVLLAHEEGTT